MDYSPWSERENWPFLRVAVSPKPKRPRPPKLVSMNMTSILTCMNFFSRIRSIKIFADHGLLSMVRKGKLAVFEGCGISETKETTPTKIGVYELDINPNLHEFFQPNPID